jgi:hypothetical protein
LPDEPQRTVFVFGAGASAASDFRLPVMRGFLQNLDHHDPRVAQLYYYCDRFFPFTDDVGPPQVDFGNLNLEDVYTQLELDEDHLASIQGLAPGFFLQQGSGWPLDQPTIKRQLLNYVRWRLEIVSSGRTERPACTKHTELLRRAFASDSRVSVLTLNYDLVADMTLRFGQVGDPGIFHTSGLILNPPRGDSFRLPSIDKSQTTIGRYLKLHGSLDWLFCPNEACTNHQVFFPGYQREYTDQEYEAGDPCSECGTDLEWVLVPPTMKKSFEKYPKLGLIWRLAHEELKVADKVIFFGVSMAPSDYYLHWLIRSSLVYRDPKPEVVVINPCGEAVERTKQLTGVEPRRYECVEEYLDARDSRSDADLPDRGR